MTKEKFKKVARKYLAILQNPQIDENGDYEMKIYGLDNLYDKLFPNDNVCHCHIPKPDPFTANSICENCGGDIIHNKLEEEQIEISRELLENLRENLIDLIETNGWKNDTTKSNNNYMGMLHKDLLQIDKLLKQ